MAVHELKIRPGFFAPVRAGIKNFEIRKNDRDFKDGDILVLKEWSPTRQEFTGRSVRRTVRYVTDYKQQEGYVVMGVSE